MTVLEYTQNGHQVIQCNFFYCCLLQLLFLNISETDSFFDDIFCEPYGLIPAVQVDLTRASSRLSPCTPRIGGDYVITSQKHTSDKPR